MPAVTVGLPAALTSPHPAQDVACEASTVGQALRAVVARAPQYEERIFYGSRLLVIVTLNGRQIPADAILETQVAAGDRVDVLLPVAGG